MGEDLVQRCKLVLSDLVGPNAGDGGYHQRTKPNAVFMVWKVKLRLAASSSVLRYLFVTQPLSPL